MRYVHTEMTQADMKRIGLAAKHARFDLSDPCERFHERGFRTHISDRGISVRFKGHQIATMRNGRGLDVIDSVPTEADAALRALVNAVRDTAKRADRMIREDRRALQAKIDAMKGGPDEFPISAEDLHALLVIPGEDPEIRIQKGYSFDDEADAYTVFAQSTFYRETKITVEQAFTVKDGAIHKGRLAIPAESLRAMIDHARARYDAIAATIVINPAPPQTFSQEELNMIHHVSGMESDVNGITFKDDYNGYLSVKVEGVRMMDIIVDQPDDEENFLMTIRHGGLSHAMQNGMLSLLKAEMESRKVVAPEIPARLSEEEVGVLAGAALAEVNLGYGF